jgi:beta-xylosidase
VVKAVRYFLDAGVDYTTFFSYHEYPHRREQSPTFSGSLAMIALNGVPKPVYNAFVFLHELRGGSRLPLGSSNDPLDGLAVRMPDGAIRIVLTSYDEDRTRQPYETAVTLELTGLGAGDWRCTRLWAADENHGNSYGAWLELGKPPAADEAARAAMLEAGGPGELPPPEVTRDGDTLRTTLPLSSPGIRFLELCDPAAFAP